MARCEEGLDPHSVQESAARRFSGNHCETNAEYLKVPVTRRASHHNCWPLNKCGGYKPAAQREAQTRTLH
jgi:hypothetical protein